MTIHPVADLFPLMAQDELRALADDIKANGQQLRIVVKDGVLLDGRNRLKACEMAYIEPLFTEYGGTDPVAFIISANLHRRHLNESQRADVAGRLANIDHGDIGGGHDRQTGKSAGLVTQTEAAALLNVSERMVRDAKSVQREAPELAAKVAAGGLTVHAATQQIKESKGKVTGEKTDQRKKGGRLVDPLDTTIDPGEPEADPDSSDLYHLKRYWRMATKKDKLAFRRWMDENHS